MEVIRDQKAEVDFNQYTTYTLEYENKAGRQNRYLNELNHNRFDLSLNEALSQRGLVSVDDNPDVYIKVIADLDTKTNFSTSYNNGSFMVGRRYYYGAGMGTSQTREYTTEVGSITVALVDGENEELLWYVGAKGDLKRNPKNADKIIQKSVDRLMQEFPINHQEINS
ncbi:MAG: DUF4136 domain-containing protein [Cyclobacteriaceae bacterium]